MKNVFKRIITTAAAALAAALPLLFSARTEVLSQRMTKTVIIDAGHGALY